MKLIFYCPNVKPYLVDERKIRSHNFVLGDSSVLTSNEKDLVLNGKIIAECDFKVEEIEHYIHYEPEVDVGIAVLPSFECEAYHTNTTGHFELLKQSCLTEDKLFSYLKGNNGYAIHIKNLHIFNDPRELDDYEYTRRVKGKPILRAVLFEAPKDMKKIIANGTDAILIRVHPEELCRILNGEQTIIIKKRILREMKK